MFQRIGRPEFINLTPHALNVRLGDGSIMTLPKPDGDVKVPRVTTERVTLYPIPHGDEGGVPLSFVEVGNVVENLPPVENKKLYVVSAIVLTHPDVAERVDLVAPGELVRDEEGRVIGCDGFTAHPNYDPDKLNNLWWGIKPKTWEDRKEVLLAEGYFNGLNIAGFVPRENKEVARWVVTVRKHGEVLKIVGRRVYTSKNAIEILTSFEGEGTWKSFWLSDVLSVQEVDYVVYEKDDESSDYSVRESYCYVTPEAVAYEKKLGDERVAKMQAALEEKREREEYEAWVAEAKTPVADDNPSEFRACGGTFKVAVNVAFTWEGLSRKAPNVIYVVTEDAHILVGDDNPRHKGNPRLKRDEYGYHAYRLSIREGETALIRSFKGDREAYLTVYEGYLVLVSGEEGEELGLLPPVKES